MIADWLPNLLLGWGVQLTAVASPGPGVALILSIATGQGRGPALSACLGIGCAALLMAIATVLGLAALWSGIALFVTAIKLAGAAYLAWLAWGSFRKAIAPPELPTSAPRRSGRRNALHGFLMQLTNPKALAFWVAIAALAGLHEAPLPVIAIFLAGAFAISVAGHGAWALALSSLPFRAFYARSRRWVEGALGAFFAFAAFKLATART